MSFKFTLDAYAGKRDAVEQREIIEGFGYLDFRGRIRMNRPDEEFVVCEEWELLTPKEHSVVNRQIHGSGEENSDCRNAGDWEDGSGLRNKLSARRPKQIFFARHLGVSRRDWATKHDLKKRPYISTTSMDAELALVTVNLACVGPGKLFLDPFTGTGGFMVAAAELGAIVLGSDIDGRSFRGKSKTKDLERGVGANFQKYGIQDRWGDCITADLTNSPFRVPGKLHGKSTRWLDGIVCDPPYGVREGLKVLGRRDPGLAKENGRTDHTGPYFVDGVPSHTLPGFVPPKRPYSFNRMLGDILDFAARTLDDKGRLAFWMPIANDADEEFPVPQHPMLDLRGNCVQVFNKWSRRLLVYERVTGEASDEMLDEMAKLTITASEKGSADDLNQFRRMYFRGFQNGSAQTAD